MPRDFAFAESGSSLDLFAEVSPTCVSHIRGFATLKRPKQEVVKLGVGELVGLC
jgi:hypothetical protein